MHILDPKFRSDGIQPAEEISQWLCLSEGERARKQQGMDGAETDSIGLVWDSLTSNGSPNYLVLKGPDRTSGDRESAVSGCWADRGETDSENISSAALKPCVNYVSYHLGIWELRWTFRVSAAARWATDGSFLQNGCLFGPSLIFKLQHPDGLIFYA